MRARATLILFFFLAGCAAPFVPSGVVEPDVVIGSYIGSVQPFTIPVQLRIREVPSFVGTVNYSLASLNEPTVRVNAMLTGSVRKLGEKYLHTTNFEEFSVKGKRLRGSEPVYVSRSLSDELGKFEEAEATVSDFARKLGLSVEDLGDTTNAAPFRIAPVSLGDDIFEAGSVGFEMRNAMNLDEKLQVRSDTMRATAKGFTFHQGRRHLLAEYGGFLDLYSGSDQATLTVRGFVLIDIDTGLPTLGQLGLTATGREDGNPFAKEFVVKIELEPR